MTDLEEGKENVGLVNFNFIAKSLGGVWLVMVNAFSYKLYHKKMFQITIEGSLNREGVVSNV